jgi:hypothetical protein
MASAQESHMPVGKGAAGAGKDSRADAVDDTRQVADDGAYEQREAPS